MSHSLSSQAHSTTAANASNVSPLHHSGSTTVKVAPRSVLVNWSESSRLNEGEEFPFDIFEAIALKAALDNPLGGYDKTDITENFDNGHQHRCRVDQMVAALNVVLAENSEKIVTKEDFEMLLEQIEVWEKASS